MPHFRMQDELFWADLSHPQPGAAKRLELTVDPAFWERLVAHLEAGRRPWDLWLGAANIDQLLSRGGPADDGGTLPDEIVRIVRDTLNRAMERKTVLAFGPGTGKSPAGWWRALSDEGLIFLVAWRDGRAMLVDCYFGAGAEAIDSSRGPAALHATGEELAGQFVLRYARFDPRQSTFTLSDRRMGETGGPAFLNPEAWGFKKADRGYRWQPPAQRSRPRARRARMNGSLHYAALEFFSPLTANRPLLNPPDLLSHLAPDAADPLRLREHLLRSYETAEEATAMASSAPRVGLESCYDLAVRLGMCEVFGTAPTEPEGGLTPAAARSAGMALQERLHQCAAHVNHLPTRLKTQSPACQEETCINLIEQRTRAWAAFRAIDRALTDEMGRGDREVAHVLQSVTSAMQSLDQALERTRDHWAPWLAGTELASNWRKMLAPAADPAPWWMQPEEAVEIRE